MSNNSDIYGKAKVALIGSEEEENLSIRYLGAVLGKRDDPVKILPFNGELDNSSSIIDKIKEFEPDLIGITMAFQSLAEDFLGLIEEIRESGWDGHLTVGGHFPTFEYKEILKRYDEIDSVVRFEGEKSIVELADVLEGRRNISEVSNLVYRKDGKIIENECIHEFPDLNKLPTPLRRETPLKRMGENFTTLLSSRGCWHSNCLYCCIGAFHKNKEKRHKLRSPLNITKEIAYLYYKKKIKVFQFHDDNFLLKNEKKNIDRLEKIKTHLKEMGINPTDLSFLIKARPDTLSRDVVSSLDKLGVVGVFLGVENASNSGLEKLIRGSRMEDVTEAVSLLEEFDIPFTYNLLIFHPLATLEEINKNIYFMKENNEHPYDFGRAEIVSSSPLERIVRDEGLLKGKWPTWDYKIKDDNVERMFKIFKEVFWRSNSLSSLLAHRLISLDYQAGAMTHLYQGPLSERLREGVRDLISNVNDFRLNKLLQVYKLSTETVTEKKVNVLASQLQNGCRKYLIEVNNLSNQMKKLQSLERFTGKLGIERSFQNSKLIKGLV